MLSAADAFQAVRVLIATDIRLYREGLARLLEQQGIRVVPPVAAAHLVPAALEGATADVVLLDMALPGSPALARTIAEEHPAVRIVALAVPQSERAVLDCAAAGVAGYALREASVEELVATIRSAATGELRCPPVIAEILRQRLARPLVEEQTVLVRTLTPREREIVPLIDQGFDNKTIARTLGIEVATVKNHVHNILEKLQVHRRGEAAARLGGRVA